MVCGDALCVLNVQFESVLGSCNVLCKGALCVSNVPCKCALYLEMCYISVLYLPEMCTNILATRVSTHSGLVTLETPADI